MNKKIQKRGAKAAVDGNHPGEVLIPIQRAERPVRSLAWTRQRNKPSEPLMNLKRSLFVRARYAATVGKLCAIIVGLAPLTSAFAADKAQPTCTARSLATMTRLVELYTSEGCSSCPQADRWLSRIAANVDASDNTVALAFHVDYWDRLGWKDRFASPTYTARQSQQQATNGAKFSYTPQVVLDGKDHKDWINTRLPLKPAAQAQAQITLTREGNQFIANVAPVAGGPIRLAAYWAVTELNHLTSVKSGENEGVTLKHDFVVREYQPVSVWSGRADTPTTLSFTPSTPVDAKHARQVNLVVVDADNGKLLQALKLGC